MNTNLPLWKMAKAASPNSFADFPAIFPVETREKEKFSKSSNTSYSEISKAVNALDKSTDKVKPIFYYASSNYGIALMLSSVYSRIADKKDEKIFLKGNASLAKLTKSILEKDKNLFIESEKCLEGNADDLGELYLPNAPIISSFECAENLNGTSDLKVIFVPKNTTEEQIKFATLLPLKQKSEPIDKYKKPEIHKIHKIIFDEPSFTSHSAGIVKFNKDQEIRINFENGTQWYFKILEGFLTNFRSGPDFINPSVPKFADGAYTSAVCLHDANYTVNKDGYHNLSRDAADALLKSMIDWGTKNALDISNMEGEEIKSLEVSKWKSTAIQLAVNLIGWTAWADKTSGNSKFVMPMAVSRWKPSL